MSDRILTVSKFVKYINDALRSFYTVKVQGEVTDFSINRNKWVSFDLKDEETEQILPCFTSYSLFKSQGLSDVLEDGMRVQVRGQVKVRTRGQFSMFTKQIELEGEGTLQKAYEKLKEKLKKEGVFAKDRKRDIPEFPQKIGIITSPEAKAYSDFLKVLKNRIGGIEILFYPVHVQGENAVKEIQHAFSYFDNNRQELDLIVLTRGGGSLEDLKAFNSEEVARSVFSSSIPVVCGVGHQEDETLAGLAADLRTSTPSNAAELIVKHREHIISEIKSNIEKMEKILKNNLKEKRGEVENFFISSSIFLDDKKSKLDKIFLELRHELSNFTQEIKNNKNKIEDYKQNLKDKIKNKITTNINNLNHQKKLLESYSPKDILNRGYSIVKSEQKIIKNSDQIDMGDQVKVKLSEGRFDSKVINLN